MKYKNVVAAAGTLLTGTLLLSVSPPTCGCVEPWREFTNAFQVPYPHDISAMDSRVLAQAGNQHLPGTPLSEFKFGSIRPSNCVQNDAQAFDCEFWLFKGVVRERGFRVHAAADPNGNITSVRVTDLHRIFGKWDLPV